MAGQASGPCEGAAGTKSTQCRVDPCPSEGRGLYPKHISGSSYLTQQLMLELLVLEICYPRLNGTSEGAAAYVVGQSLYW